MKKKRTSKFQNKAVGGAPKEIREQREKLEGLSFDLAAGKVKNIRKIRHLKKNIAQILTLLKQHA